LSTQQQQGPARAKPDLFLPRHPGDVVRLVAALAVLLVSIKLVNRNHIDELEIDAFRLVNDLPGVLYPLLWVIMQLGNVLAVPVLAGVAALTRRYRLAVNLAVAGFGCYFLAILVKNLVHRGRPSQYLPDVNRRGVGLGGQPVPEPAGPPGRVDPGGGGVPVPGLRRRALAVGRDRWRGRRLRCWRGRAFDPGGSRRQSVSRPRPSRPG